MAGTDHGSVTAGDRGEGEWARGVDRFAAWLADFSPFYRGLRIPVHVPDDAPARLAYFWQTVGWAPGVGVGWRTAGFPPLRELGRVEADRAFRRWLAAECCASAMGLAEPTAAALWERLPRRCWVLAAGVDTNERNLRAHGGHLYYVDEDAGDDPPLMLWSTANVDQHVGSMSPGVAATSSVASLVGSTLGKIIKSCGIDLRLPAPERASPFAPFAANFLPLADGVWGVTGDARTTIERVVCRSARAYLELLAGLPAECLPAYHTHVYRMHGAHKIRIADARALSPQRLAERGFTYVEHDWPGVGQGTDTVVAGRLDDIPVAGFFSTRPHGSFFWVAPEDARALRAVLTREKVRVLDQARSGAASLGWWAALGSLDWCTEPDDGIRAWVAQQVKRAEQAMAGVGRSTPRRGPRRVSPGPVSGSAEEAVVRAEAAALREWILAACPGLELTPPKASVGESPLVRALWQGLGYADELKEVTGLPDRRSSEHAMARALAVYRGRDCELRRTSLPQRFRLLWICDDDDSELLITDEDTPAVDPPLLAVSADGGEVTRVDDFPFPGYLGWVGQNAAYYAAQWQPSLEVRTDPPLTELGTQPYPRLAPSVRHLAPGIWACPQWHLPSDGEANVGAARFHDLVEWLAQTTMVDRLELLGWNARCRPYASLRLQWFAPPAGMREWRAPTGDARCYAGSIDDLPILVKVTDKITLLCTSHADRQRAEPIATAAGWTDRARRRRTPPT